MNRVYEVGCLCVVPEYQGKGIGTQAIRFIKSYYEDWKLTVFLNRLNWNKNFVGWIWEDLFLLVVRYGELQIRFQRL